MAFLSQATSSWGLASSSRRFLGACCSQPEVVRTASLQRLIGYLYTRGVSTFLYRAFTAHRAFRIGARPVPRDHLHAGMRPEPLREGLGGALRQEGHRLP